MSASKILELYARSGRSLISNGLNEAALPLAEAEAALELFGKQQWRVLGGDVYHLTADGHLKPTYENWFYEGNSIEESLISARQFINGLAGRQDYIVFVIGDKR
jgi:hypothetical protein